MAIADFTSALELDPQHSRAYYYRANAHESLSETSRAIADYQTVVQISTDPTLTELAETRLVALGTVAQ